MSSSTSARLRAVAGAGLVLTGALTLTACGEVRAPGSTAAATPSASASARGASPYVEPGTGDGAPHYNENNAYRQSGDMSPAHAKDAEREAERIRPVLKQLWEQRKWEPSAVRSALLRLGYEEERITKDGKRLGGTLTVRDMFSRYENDGYVTPEGSEPVPYLRF